MKKLFLTLMLTIALFAMPVAAMAAFHVTFAWDANTEPDLAGYMVYQSPNSNSYPDTAIGTIPAGTETITLQVENEGTYYWIFTSYDTSGNENDKILSYPYEVTATLVSEPPPDTTPPAPPAGTRIIVIIEIPPPQ